MVVSHDPIVEAAFRLFSSRGYDATSADDIAAEAGVSRSTFFRSYRSKESVIFPDHDRLLARVEERLRNPVGKPGLGAVTDAVRIVLMHYVAEGERARERYRLTSSVPVLRERELVSEERYQRLFRRYLSQWGDRSEESELRAEVMSAAVVAAHNHVLRQWLRGECPDPRQRIEVALASVRRLFEAPEVSEQVGIVVVPAGVSLQAVERAVRRAAADTAPPS